MTDCLVCTRLAEIRAGTNPFLIAEFETGYVVLGDCQYFKGYTLFLAKDHLTELHHLPSERRWLFLKEMSLVAEAVHAAIRPAKMNYELLGNSESHLHWHLFPRAKDELAAHKGPIWWVPAAERNADAARPSEEERASLVAQVRTALERVCRDQGYPFVLEEGRFRAGKP